MPSGHWTSLIKHKKFTAIAFAMVLTVVGYQNCNPMLFEGKDLASQGGPSCDISLGATDFKVETRSGTGNWVEDSWNSISANDQLRVTLLEQHQSQFLEENVAWSMGRGNNPNFEDNGTGFQATWSTGLAVGSYILRVQLAKACVQAHLKQESPATYFALQFLPHAWADELVRRVVDIPFTILNDGDNPQCNGFGSLSYRADPTRVTIGTSVTAQFHGSAIPASCARATRFDFGNGTVREQESQLSALDSYSSPGLYMTRGDLYRPNLNGSLERRGYQEVLVIRPTTTCDLSRDLVLRAPSVVRLNQDFTAVVGGPEVCLQQLQGVRFNFNEASGQPNAEDVTRPFENTHQYSAAQQYTISASVRAGSREPVILRHTITAVGSSVCSSESADLVGASLSGPTALELTSAAVVGSYHLSIPSCLLPTNFQASSVIWRLSKEGVSGQTMLPAGGFAKDVSFSETGVYFVSASFSSTAGAMVLSRRVVIYRGLVCPVGSSASGNSCQCSEGEYDAADNKCYSYAAMYGTCTANSGAACVNNQQAGTQSMNRCVRTLMGTPQPVNTDVDFSFCVSRGEASAIPCQVSCTSSCSNGATNPSACTACPNGMTVSGPAQQCPACNGADQYVSNGQCLSCPVGQIPNATRTGCVGCGANQIENPAGTCTTCPSGQAPVNNVCQVTSCPNGATNPSACTACPNGMTVSGPAQQCPACSGSNQFVSGGQCVTCVAPEARVGSPGNYRCEDTRSFRFVDVCSGTVMTSQCQVSSSSGQWVNTQSSECESRNVPGFKYDIYGGFINGLFDPSTPGVLQTQFAGACGLTSHQATQRLGDRGPNSPWVLQPAGELEGYVTFHRNLACDSGFTLQGGACVQAPPQNCSFNGQVVAHGTSVNAFTTSSVPFGTLCNMQIRQCNDGVLSGTATFPQCAPRDPANCTLAGQPVGHGSSVQAFAVESVSFGQSCPAAQTRTCTNGVLSGSGEFRSCSVQAAPSCGRQDSAGPCRVTRRCENGTILGSQTGVNLPSVINPIGTPVAHGSSIGPNGTFDVPGYEVVRADASYRCERGSFVMTQGYYCDVMQTVPNSTAGCGGSTGGGGLSCSNQCQFEGQTINVANDCCSMLGQQCSGAGSGYYVRTLRCVRSGSGFTVEQDSCGFGRVSCN